MTPRELQCALLVSLAFSNHQIALKMELKKHTVANLVCLIYQKLDTKGKEGRHPRVALARWVWEHHGQGLSP